MSQYEARKSTGYIIIHCSATTRDMDVDAATIREWHLEQGWVDIGYHLVIRRDGVVECGRPLDTVGAHTKFYNDVSVSVCLVGGAYSDGRAEDNFTLSQWSSLRATLMFLNRMYPRALIKGHNFFNSEKECPSFDVDLKVRELGLYRPVFPS